MNPPEDERAGKEQPSAPPQATPRVRRSREQQPPVSEAAAPASAPPQAPQQTKPGARRSREQQAPASEAAAPAPAPPRSPQQVKPGARRPRGQQPPALEAAAPASAPPRAPRLREKYRQEVVPALMQQFGYANVMQVPRLEKVVLNIGLGEAITNARALEMGTRDLTLIAGQQPVTTRARKAIANFKLREGMPIGVMVTLRAARMFEFLDKLMNVSLVRIRDFRGTPRESFDGRGNYSLGIREQLIFPEIDYNIIDRLRGLQVSIVTTARTDEEGLRLLELLGMPYARQDGVRP